MDSFTILGIGRDASPAEIKRAYRRLAMTWHPDRNSHPEATERFKEIRSAYEALQGRAEEEEAQPARTAAGGMPPAEDEVPPAEDELPPARAPSIRLDLELGLEEAAASCEKSLRFRRQRPCATCAGSGQTGTSHSRPCPLCHGSGRIRQRQHGLASCPECGGRGFLRRCTCPDCGGSGRESGEVVLQVTVPAGMLPGDELRLAGQGEAGGDGLAAGDLFLTIVLRPHELFTRDGCDLSLAMPVGALTLLAGGRVPVPTLAGVEWLELEAGEIGPRSVRLAGRGYPGRRRERPGDLVVHLQPVWPQSLSERQRRLLQAAAAAFEEDPAASLPEVARWRQRHLP